MNSVQAQPANDGVSPAHEAQEANSGQPSITIDPEFASIIPPPTATELAILEESLVQDGCRDPLLVMPTGVLLDGHNRLRICRERDIQFAVEVVDVADHDQALLWIINNQLGRRNLADIDRIALVARREHLLRERAAARQATRSQLPQNSAEADQPVETRKVAAKAAGVSHDTYAKGKKVIERGVPELAQAVRDGDASIHAAAQVADLSPNEQREAVSSGTVKQVAKAQQSRRKGASGSSEWYTPDWCLSAAREVLGDFDLDPASCTLAQKRVRAKTYYDKDQDGLSQPWAGTVWLNPPFTRGLMPKFVDKLVAEVDAGNVTAAILLTNSETETAWFQAAASKASRLCFPCSRIRFLRGAAGTQSSPQMGQTLFYFGSDCERFAEVFRELGVVMTPMPIAESSGTTAPKGGTT